MSSVSLSRITYKIQSIFVSSLQNIYRKLSLFILKRVITNSIMFRPLRTLSATFNLAKKLPNVACMSDTHEPADLKLMEIPNYDINRPQTLEKRKARLHYQSRKRGMLENDLLLSTFAKKYLDNLNEEQTMMYDRLINSPSNDWDIFYWIVEKQPTPQEFDNEVMDLLKKHAKNEERNSLRMPDLF